MFYARLALRLGRSVRELLQSLSSEELTMWMAYDLIEPIGDWRFDLGFGVVASTIANANRAQGASPFKPIDFMPLSERPKEQPLAATVRSFLRSVPVKKKE